MGARTFASETSIVLIGIRGTGRSSLAIFAANSLGFRLVDTDALFLKTTGLSRRAYATAHGHEACQREELRAVRAALDQNPTNSVIVCGLVAVHKSGQQLLRDFARAHPIIYVVRDDAEVAAHLQCSVRAITDAVDLGNSTFRALSQYEFYNLPDTTLADTTTGLGRPPSLVLKNIERDFLELLLRIRGRRPTRMGHAQTSLSQLPLEMRAFTYALSLPLALIPVLRGQLGGVDLLSDAVELVIDLESLLGPAGFSHATATHISRLFYALKRDVRLPVIFHVKAALGPAQPAEPSHDASFLQDQYVQTVEHGLRLGPEFLTLNLHLPDDKIRAVISRKGHTTVIGDFFDAAPTSNAWESVARRELPLRAEALGCDMLRIYQPANSSADNVLVQKFAHYANTVDSFSIPLIAYNTGPLGRISCIRNRILTPVIHTLAQKRGYDENEQWMLTVSEAIKALYDSGALDDMRFGIFGSDVQSSLSPILHNAAFAHYGMPHVYQTFQSSTLNSFSSLLEDPRFGGASITAPFKTDILPLLDHLSPAAQAIGAVNTVLPLRSTGPNALLDRSRRGRIIALYGENTDWIGIHTSIRRHLSPVNAVTNRTTGLVLGAGGMAHAAIYSMICLGVRNIYVWNRNKDKAEKLAQRFSERLYPAQHTGLDMSKTANTGDSPCFGPSTISTVSSLEAGPCGWPEPPNVIVSCIPNPSLTLPDAWLSSKTGGVLVELAYVPLETPLLAQVRGLAAGRGWIAVDGLYALQEQAVAQFELFTGRKAPGNFMRSEMGRRNLVTY